MELEKLITLAKKVNEREKKKLGLKEFSMDAEFKEAEEGVEVKLKSTDTDKETTCYLDLLDKEKIAIVVDNSIKSFAVAHISLVEDEQANDSSNIILTKEVVEKLVESGIVKGVTSIPAFMYKGKPMVVGAWRIHEDIEETVKVLKEKGNIILYNVQTNKYGTIVRLAHVK